jgi:hypothetical protein
MNYYDDIEIFSEGWIFLTGGSNYVKDYIVGGKKISDDTLKEWYDLLYRRVSYFQDKQIKFVTVFAPEKLSIYKHKTPYKVADENLPSYQLLNFLQSKQGVTDHLLDLIPYLRAQSRSFKVYHKTDSHWNFHGAFCAYQLIQSFLSRAVYKGALSRPRKENWSTMDLGGKLEPPLKEKVFFYNSSDRFKRIWANELVQFKERENRTNDPGLHVGSHVVFENQEPLSDEVLIIFGDSFSEYRDHLLTGLMAETYQRVHFVWGIAVDKDIIESVKPDIVISEIAERFLVRPPQSNWF